MRKMTYSVTLRNPVPSICFSAVLGSENLDRHRLRCLFNHLDGPRLSVLLIAIALVSV